MKSLLAKWSALGFEKQVELALGIAIAIFTASIMVFAYLQVQVTKEAAYHQNRAYVVLDGLPVVEELYGGDGKQITITIKNVGNTPAYNSNIHAITFVGSHYYDSNPIDSIFAHIRGSRADSGFVFGPTVAIVEQESIDNDLIRAMSEGEKFFYCLGRITYQDYLGTPHHTNYCFMYVTRDGRMRPFEKHNYAN